MTLAEAKAERIAELEEDIDIMQFHIETAKLTEEQKLGLVKFKHLLMQTRYNLMKGR